jgi:hypothetical protein
VPAGGGVTWVGLDVLGNQSLFGKPGGVLNIPIDLDNISLLSTTGKSRMPCRRWQVDRFQSALHHWWRHGARG